MMPYLIYFKIDTDKKFINISIKKINNFDNYKIINFEKKDFILDFLKENIQSQLGTYFPSVIIVSLDVLGKEDNNIIEVVLKYRVQNTSISDTLNITFD